MSRRMYVVYVFFFSSRRRHTRWTGDWSSDVCSSDLIPLTLITDNMVGHFLKTGGVSAVVVGADRIARNGDTANKIGTYGIAVLARENRSEERRVGKSVELGGRRNSKKKKMIGKQREL